MRKIWRNLTSFSSTRTLTASASEQEVNDLDKTGTSNKSVTHVVSLALLVIIVFAGDRFFGYVLGQMNMSSHFRYSKVYSGRGKCDILLLGNSRGHMLFQPPIKKITGKSTLNLSYNALPASVANGIVQDYYDRYPAPASMLIEVTMLNKTETKVVNEFKAYYPESARLRRIIRETSPTVAAGVDVSSLYAYNTELFHRSLYYLDESDDNWILDKKINAGMVANTSDIEEASFDITEDRMRDFLSIINTAKKNGTKVSLVVAPLYPAYLAQVNNIDSFITKIEKASGLKVYNYSDFLTSNDHFSDYLHLNRAGSILFIEQMRKDGVL